MRKLERHCKTSERDRLVQHAFITTRKRSLGQGNIFAPVCHSVHRGEYLGKYTPLGRYIPPGQVHLPSRYTPLGQYSPLAGAPMGRYMSRG